MNLNFFESFKEISLSISLLCLLNLSAAQPKPNILLILVDDAGYSDFGFTNPDTKLTPNIDALAKRGIVFSRSYVTSSVCAPSRASILTGIYQNRFGFEYNLYNHSPAPHFDEGEVGLLASAQTIPEILKPLGYKTAAFGKWHLGESPTQTPNNQGFDYFFGFLGGARNYWQMPDPRVNQKLMRNEISIEFGSGYLTNKLVDEFIEWTTFDPSKSFFAYLSLSAVHGPYQARQQDRVKISCDSCSTERREYLAMISNLDDNVKKIVDFLSSTDQLANTLIIFSNDNGGPFPGVITNNYPFRSGKASPFEGGIRVPTFISWTDRIFEPKLHANMISSIDIAPTILDAAGFTGELMFDGKSLLPIIENNSLNIHKNLFWQKKWDYSIIMDSTHKLIIREGRDTSLYNLQKDPQERVNLFYDSQIVNPLIDKLSSWQKELPLPFWIDNNVLSKVNCENPDCGYFSNIFDNHHFLETYLCPEDTIIIGNKFITIPGIYIDTLTSEIEADSIIFLSVLNSERKETFLSTTLCENDIFLIANDTITSAGSYQYSFESLNYCDSLVNLEVLLGHNNDTTIYTSSCPSEPFIYNEDTIVQNGTYLFNFLNSQLCDSLVRIEHTVFPANDTTIYTSSCPSEPFIYNEDTIVQNGSYLFNFLNSQLCDSLVRIEHTVFPANDTIIYHSACPTDPILLFEEDTISKNGQYQFTFQNSLLCDSTVTIEYSVSEISDTTIYFTSCDGDSLFILGDTITQDGHFQFNLQDTQLCDSVVHVEHLILPVYDTTITVIGNSNKIQSSTMDTLLNIYNCDSIIRYQYILPATPSVQRAVLTPNPVITNLSVSFPYSKSYNVQLFNISGVLILDYKGYANDHTDIDMSQLSQGVYLLRLNLDNVLLHSKVIKK